jgi:hypothetical protein
MSNGTLDELTSLIRERGRRLDKEREELKQLEEALG